MIEENIDIALIAKLLELPQKKIKEIQSKLQKEGKLK